MLCFDGNTACSRVLAAACFGAKSRFPPCRSMLQQSGAHRDMGRGGRRLRNPESMRRETALDAPMRPDARDQGVSSDSARAHRQRRVNLISSYGIEKERFTLLIRALLKKKRSTVIVQGDIEHPLMAPQVLSPQEGPDRETGPWLA